MSFFMGGLDIFNLQFHALPPDVMLKIEKHAAPDELGDAFDSISMQPKPLSLLDLLGQLDSNFGKYNESVFKYLHLVAPLLYPTIDDEVAVFRESVNALIDTRRADLLMEQERTVLYSLSQTQTWALTAEKLAILKDSFFKEYNIATKMVFRGKIPEGEMERLLKVKEFLEGSPATEDAFKFFEKVESVPWCFIGRFYTQHKLAITMPSLEDLFKATANLSMLHVFAHDYSSIGDDEKLKIAYLNKLDEPDSRFRDDMSEPEIKNAIQEMIQAKKGQLRAEQLRTVQVYQMRAPKTQDIAGYCRDFGSDGEIDLRAGATLFDLTQADVDDIASIFDQTNSDVGKTEAALLRVNWTTVGAEFAANKTDYQCAGRFKQIVNDPVSMFAVFGLVDQDYDVYFPSSFAYLNVLDPARFANDQLSADDVKNAILGLVTDDLKADFLLDEQSRSLQQASARSIIVTKANVSAIFESMKKNLELELIYISQFKKITNVPFIQQVLQELTATNDLNEINVAFQKLKLQDFLQCGKFYRGNESDILSALQ